MMFWLIKDILANFIHTCLPAGRSDFETEKAEADCCHSNIPTLSLLSLINLEQLSATIVANISSDIFGEREARK
jgi:hypothetical protein